MNENIKAILDEMRAKVERYDKACRARGSDAIESCIFDVEEVRDLLAAIDDHNAAIFGIN